jgi:hypothetical protein
MSPTLAHRLGEARARNFVGRQDELDQFTGLLGAPDQAAVVVVHGPAGIGKSALVRQFAGRARTANCLCLYVDARDLPATVEGLTAGLGELLDAEPHPGGRRTVVLIDDYELLADLDTTFRELIAPRLPADVLLLLAGQNPPSLGWRTDEGWAPILQTMHLGNLGADECRSYLTARGVPREFQPPAIAFTHGHPLALALIGEVVRKKGPLEAADSIDVVRVLLDRLLDEVPTGSHRAALEATALVRVVNEPLLAGLLDIPDSGELFAWMRNLPFVDAGRAGLYLHDLARDVLVVDLQWRDPDRFAAYHDRARKHYLDRLDSANPGVQSGALLDLIYLHPNLRAFLQPPDDSAALRLESLRPDDVGSVNEMVTRHEGAASGRLARGWLAERPETWSVVRGLDGASHGAVCLLPLESLGPTDDPAVTAARAELLLHPPLRPGETATLVRFWLTRDDYQSVSPSQSLIATQFARHFLTTTGLAVTLLPFAQAQDWEAFCAYADQRRAPTADFTVGGHHYSSFVHDWRTATPAMWVARLSQQEIGATPPSTPTDTSSDVLVLAEKEFANAVRQALRDYTRTDRLRSNPLLRCRLVSTRLTANQGPAEQAVLLKTLLKEASETLAAVPADRRLHRVLVRAYLAPAPTLEKAAEVLELPSSTFRRLLATAIDRISTILWHQELDS